MSNGTPGSPGFNIKVTQSAVSAPPNGAGITKPDLGSPQVVERSRTISPLTQYNPESGLVEADPASPWGGQAKPIEEPKPPETPPADPAAPSRREAWKAEQDKRSAERAEKQRKAIEEKQPLVRDFLKKGDLAGAAKALGMTAAEFREYAQNVLLTMPTPDKELTPEQKLEKERQEIREEREAIKKRQDQLEYAQTADRYIRDRIRPVLSDKEKYEFISQQEPAKIEAYIYQFMNEHYAKTREELNPSDVADTIEAELERAFVQSIERHKPLKKVAKLFAPKPAEEAAPQLSAEVEEPEPAPVERPQLRQPPAAKPPPAPRQAVIRSEQNGSRVPFALLSREERLAALREEENT